MRWRYAPGPRMAQTSPTSASTARRSSGGSLSEILARGARYADISAHLDALSPAARLEQVLDIRGSAVGRLYEAVIDAPRMTTEEFCPPALTEGKTLIYEGRNSLPAFSRFQKRFQRRGDQIVGYNHQNVMGIIGPGYFMTTDGDEFRRELLFDYTQAPAFFPTGWPAYKPNTYLLSRPVYYNMKDYCRRVARGVVVGMAFKEGNAMGAFFTLTLPA